MSDMTKAIGNEVLLTSDDIRSWQLEMQKWERTKAEADSHIVELRKKLDAAALLFGASLPLPEIGQDDKGEESLGDAAKRLLARFSKPVFHHELQVELRKIPRFREMLDKNDGAYYYTMIARLVKGERVKRVGKKKIRLAHKDEAPPEGNPESAS